jgi:hypothetical protein
MSKRKARNSSPGDDSKGSSASPRAAKSSKGNEGKVSVKRDKFGRIITVEYEKKKEAERAKKEVERAKREAEKEVARAKREAEKEAARAKREEEQKRRRARAEKEREAQQLLRTYQRRTSKFDVKEVEAKLVVIREELANPPPSSSAGAQGGASLGKPPPISRHPTTMDGMGKDRSYPAEFYHTPDQERQPNGRGSTIQLDRNGVDANATKGCRRIYVGSLPINTPIVLTTFMMRDYFTGLCEKMGMTTPDPIINVWLHTNRTFCFVEFRSVQDALASQSLWDGMTLLGRPWKINRPSDYSDPAPGLEQYIMDHSSGEFPGPVKGKFGDLSLRATRRDKTSPILKELDDKFDDVAKWFAQEDHMVRAVGACEEATSILGLMNMVDVAAEDTEEFSSVEAMEDLVDDVRQACAQLGAVKSVLFCVPESARALAAQCEFGLDDRCTVAQDEGNVGAVFVQFANIAGAGTALKRMELRMYNNRQLDASYLTERTFKGQYSA